MPIGPGKYGDEAIALLEKLKAQGVVVVVLGGIKGSGIAVHGPALLHAGVPDMLENLARDIRKNAKSDAAAIQAGAAMFSEKTQ